MIEHIDLKTERYIIFDEIPEIEVSNMGNIRDTKTKKLIQTYKDKNGYIRIKNINILNSNSLLHRVVAKVWCKNPYNYKEVNHEDGNKENNKANNLVWCTRQYNIQEAFRLGLNNNSDLCKEKARQKMIEHNKNRNTYNYYYEHINESKHKAFPPVYQFTLDRQFINKFRTTGDAGRKLNLNSSAISKCCNHKLKTSQGYIWRYETEVMFDGKTYKPIK